MALFSRITVWNSGDILYAAALNNEFDNLLAGFTPSKIDSASGSIPAMQTTLSPGNVGTEQPAGSLLQEIQQLRYEVLDIKGGVQWYVPTPINITALNTKVDSISIPPFKSDGTDPGAGGICMQRFNISTSALTGSASTQTTSLGTLHLTTRARPTLFRMTRDNLGPTGAGLQVSTTLTNFVSGVYSLTARFQVFIGGSAFAADTRDFIFNLPHPPQNALNTGGSATSVSLPDAGTISTTPAGQVYSLSGGQTGNPTRTYVVSLTEALYSFIDTANTATANQSYEMKITLINPTFAVGTCSTTMTGISSLVLKEL